MHARQFGDFQTPFGLIREIIEILGPIGQQWDRVLEPTCGRGNFIRAIAESDSLPQEIVGIELQNHYLDEASSINSPIVKLVRGDIFRIDLSKDIEWKSRGPLLVIGNPPWVTNSEMGAICGSNVPQKTNFKGLRGIDAITGRSNFDIAEYILIKLINELAEEKATIAFLCKTSVARSVLRYAKQAGLPITSAEMRSIDAKKWFGVAADACLFTLKTGRTMHDYRAEVFTSLSGVSPIATIGFVREHFVSDVKTYQSISFIEGTSPLEWRQGIKHDAASILELTLKGGEWCNALGETVDVENEFVFPLLKGSDVQSYDGQRPFLRAVIVPQSAINQDTKHLEATAPKLWAYLCRHREMFAKRRSSIYRNKPPFSVFGVGDYSFSHFKVVVSGLYKKPRFIAVGPVDSKPVFCDDTCYLLPCDSPLQAASIATILNHALARKFVRSITFRDAKRPITKAALMRIDMIELAMRISLGDVRDELGSRLAAITNCEGSKYALPCQLLDALDLGRKSTQTTLFSSREKAGFSHTSF